MIKTALTIAIVILLIRGISTLIFLFQSFAWLKKNEGIGSKKRRKENPNIFVLIPALREQKRIVKTLEYFTTNFNTKNIKIIVITTQREFEGNFKGKSTKEIVKKFIRTHRLSKKVICINYPDKRGVMAHQLNFALDSIKDNNSFVAIYNADSRPHSDTLEILSDQIEKHPTADIFQQSSAFIKNYSDMPGSNKIVNLFLKTSAILQTRWTFAHEFPRLLRQSIFNNSAIKKYANAHVVDMGYLSGQPY